jgi:hypothetical protein
MRTEMNTQFSQLLQHLADALDIPESRYKAAEERYQAVGKWLCKEDSPLAEYDPDIYPQGSFRLGTVVKPVSQEDKYDIDLVCQLRISNGSITQNELKNRIGDRLKDSETYRQMLDKEGRRCWTLNYSEEAIFHMDILPAIPDDFGWLLALGVPNELARHAICITDKETWDKDPDWPRSNPKGYAEWFKEKMKTIFLEKKKLLAAERQVSIEDVPDHHVKTTLQRSVQILKRHRDIMFEEDPDDKPISIIITTLAAKAYDNEADLFDALISIIDGMPNYLETRNGVWWVHNPVNPRENFADKWQEFPQRAAKFKGWLQQAKKDIEIALSKRGIHEVSESLKAAFGEPALNEAVTRLGESYKNQRLTGGLRMMAGSGLVGTAGITKVRDHTFYGI